MSDFNDVLSFEKFTEGIPRWQRNMDYNNMKNIFLEKHMDEYFNFLYSRTLNLTALSENQNIYLEVAKIAQKYERILNMESIMTIDMDIELIELEKETMKQLYLSDSKNLPNKKDAYAILNSLSNQYGYSIRNILVNFSREELIKIFVAYANTISYICMQSYEWSSDGYIDKNRMNLISETLHIIEKFKISDLRFFFWCR